MNCFNLKVTEICSCSLDDVFNLISSSDKKRCVFNLMLSSDKKRCSFLNTKNRYRRQISQRDYPFKKRKLFYCCSARNSDVLINSDGICSFSENDSKGAALLPGPASPGGSSILLHAVARTRLHTHTFCTL